MIESAPAPIQQLPQQPSVLRKPKQLSMTGKADSELDKLLVKDEAGNQNVRLTSAYAEVEGGKNQALAAATQTAWRSMNDEAEKNGSPNAVRPVSPTPWKSSPAKATSAAAMERPELQNYGREARGTTNEPSTSDTAPAARRAAAKWQGVER
jgi:hypothetical protein